MATLEFLCFKYLFESVEGCTKVLRHSDSRTHRTSQFMRIMLGEGKAAQQLNFRSEFSSIQKNDL